MGCGQSKIENEETVNRCKDRKLFMKEAVSARNAFAAAHFAYTMSLKNTGAALSDYAEGEVQFPHLDDSSSHHPSSSAGGVVPPPVPPQPPYENLPPPPPPLPNFSAPPPPPLQRASSMPEYVLPKPDLKPHSDPIMEEETEDDDNEGHHGLRHRRNSSRASRNENLPPPPPQHSSPLKTTTNHTPPPPPPNNEGGMGGMSWDFFFPSTENVPGPSLAEVDENVIEREEIERKVLAERAMRSEIDGRGDEGSRRSGKADVVEPPHVMETVMEQPPPPTPTSKPVKKVRQATPAADAGKRPGKGMTSMNLFQIFRELDDCFLRASESAHDVSKMLEANRLHYHSNFADSRGHIDHSARVMRVITWNRSFRGLPNADDGVDDFDSEEHETHATVLDKMLAWEKKLYDEVKAGEQMKFEYQKKIASLNKLKKRGASTESMERTKAAVSHLHTRYIVDMQSMDSTVSEINRLRDEQLYPKLVALVDGMATMWESMRVQHESQTKVVQALRALDLSRSPKETTEHHHERTVQLWAVVQEWHSQFEKLMFHQKEYIRALNNWLKLNLIPIDNNLREKVSSPQRPQSPPIQALLQTWHDFLEKLPEELARTAIHNFAAVINTIVQYQAEEMKLRDKCEDTRKELNKKTRQFEDWYHKYRQKRTPPDDIDPDRADDKDMIADRQIIIEALKKKLEEEEEDYQRQCIQVRDKSLTSLRTRLPEVFRAVTDFSHACSHMYRSLRPSSKLHNANQSS